MASGLRQSISQSYKHLFELGFNPRNVINVGVDSGTFGLYEAFSDFFFLLIEPLKEFESDLKSILTKYQGCYVIATAGSASREVVINVHPDHLVGSSLLKESMGSEADGYEQTVPMVVVDDIIEKLSLQGPFLIKVDTQGAELDVLNGCARALKDTEVIVLEISMFEFMKGAPQFSDVIAYMKERGFVAYDIVLGWNRPLDNALGQVDIVFVKEYGPFRQSHNYSTVEQLKTL
jgi:FkbM family methyltransferase